VVNFCLIMIRENLNNVPIAWANLTHNRKNLANALAGITFAVLLMFMQIGFLNALLDSTVQFLQILDADLLLINKLTGSVISGPEPFDRSRVFQAEGFPGVGKAHYVRLSEMLWKNPETGYKNAVRVVAFNPEQQVFLDREINSHLNDLKKSETVIFDRLSKKHFGPVFKGVVSEIENRSASIVGNFSLGTDFVAAGTVMMSNKNFLNLVQKNSLTSEYNKAEIGLIKISPGEDAKKIADSLKGLFEKDLLVLTKEDLINKERDYWLTGTPVGFVFGLGAIMGFVVGAIICYQILFTDIMSRLPQFATVKAIGYSNSYLLSVVVRQSLVMALLGFFPGLLLSLVFYKLISMLFHLPMMMGPAQVIAIFFATLLMSAISGVLAALKAVAANPAELF